MILNTGLILTALFSTACKQSAPSVVESVLSEGMKITASTPSGRIVIEGKKGFTRLYSSENWSKSSVLIPRNSRWYGSLGLYDPAGGFSQHGRLLLDEGKQFFTSESEALRYLKYLSAFFGPLTYTNKGLVIAYKITEIPGGKPVRDLAVWQIYINGAKPTTLRGAVDTNVEISGGIIPETASPLPAPIGYQRELADKEYGVTN